MVLARNSGSDSFAVDLFDVFDRNADDWNNWNSGERSLFVNAATGRQSNRKWTSGEARHRASQCRLLWFLTGPIVGSNAMTAMLAGGCFKSF